MTDIPVNNYLPILNSESCPECQGKFKKCEACEKEWQLIRKLNSQRKEPIWAQFKSLLQRK